jgi:hypothetical protein
VQPFFQPNDSVLHPQAHTSESCKPLPVAAVISTTSHAAKNAGMSPCQHDASIQEIRKAGNAKK